MTEQETRDFVHLHVHTEFSLLDGAGRVDDMILAAKKLGMKALAITDHGAMYGVLKFFKKAKKEGIKPIIGCEVYVAPRSRLERTPKIDDKNFHLILLAKDLNGYKNLLYLVSTSWLDGFYYKPRVDKEILRERSSGLIALSACIGGEIPQALLSGKTEEAERLVNEYVDIFGKENFFIEIQNQGLPEEEELNPKLIELARKFDIPLVATNDIHYTQKDDAEVHDILLCVQTQKKVDDVDRMRFSTTEFYLKSQQEMNELFKNIPEAIDNTVSIADRCNLDIPLNGQFLPEFQLPEGHTSETYLKELCENNLQRRYPDRDQKILDRMEYELGIISTMGFSAYFLIVWDFIHYARSRGIPVGPGRGSAAGSIVAYLLGITNIDPIKYDLLFERFLNPERISMPDIDIDFCFERRGEVIEYVVGRYGEDRVSQIATFGTMAARNAIKDVGRALNMPYGDVDRIAKMIPEELNITIDRALQINPDIEKAINEDPMVARLIRIARGLEGIPRHVSTHAAGVVISRDKLSEHVPLQKIKGDNVSTQYPWGDVEEIGLLKMDFLGLRTLTMIKYALDLIYESRGIELTPDQIPLDDPGIYELLSKGDTQGVFQLESSGMRTILHDLRPDRFEDVIALVALYRPGPLGSGMVDDFIGGKHGKGGARSLHPLLDPILAETYGVILYQEQVMKVASALSGFSLGKADILRKAMGKKKPELVAAQKADFIAGAEKNGVAKKNAEEIFDIVEKFAGYGFNKSHSAAYAVLSCQTAYLKAHYPVEFAAAVMTSYLGNNEKVASNIVHVRQDGVEVLPPDINKSKTAFSVENNSIRFGLAAIKNVGEEVTREIIRVRTEKGEFTSFYDLCEKLDSKYLNKRTIESMIKAGAFDSFGETRATLLGNMEKVIEYSTQLAKSQSNGQMSLFDVVEDVGVEYPPLQVKLEFASDQLLLMEKEVLGFYLSGHPLYKIIDKLEKINCVSTDELEELQEETIVTYCGIITGQRQISTKKGEAMAILNVEDLVGTVEAVAYPKIYLAYRHLFFPDVPLLFEAAVRKQDEKASLIIKNIKPIEEVSPIHVFIDGPEKLENRLNCIKDILVKYQGDNPVYLHLKTMGKVILTDSRLWCKSDPETIRELCCVEGTNVKIDENTEIRICEASNKGA